MLKTSPALLKRKGRENRKGSVRPAFQTQSPRKSPRQQWPSPLRESVDDSIDAVLYAGRMEIYERAESQASKPEL